MTLVADAAAQWWAWSTLRGILLFICVAVAPGAAWGLSRRRLRQCTPDPTVTLAASVTVGLSVWILLSSVIVRAGLLVDTAIWIGAGLVLLLSTGSVALPRLRAGRRRARAASRGSHRAPRRRRVEPVEALVGGPRRRVLLPLLTALVAAAPQLAIIIQRPDALVSPTAWYYWSTARELAVLGHVPESVQEWGQSVPAFTFHFGFSSSTALLSVASGDTDSLSAAQLVRLVTVLIFGLGTWCLARSLGGSDLTAAGATLIASSVQIYAIKLSSYRPEALAYGFACLAVALLIWGLRARDRWLLAASLIGILGVTQVHGLSALLALAMIAGSACAYVFGFLAAHESWRSRAVRISVFGVLAATSTVLANLLFIGRWSDATTVQGLPSVGPDGDPTWAFALLVSAQPVLPDPPGADPPTLGAMATDSLGAVLLGTPSWSVPALSVACLALGALLCLRVRRARGVLTFGIISFLGLLGIAYLLAMTGDTYIPRRTGFTRVLQLWPVLPPIVAAAIAALIPKQAPRRAAVALVAVAAVTVAALGAPDVLKLGRGQPSGSQLVAVSRMPIKPDSTVLTNGFTQGYVTLWTPGFGLLDGHAPYLERDLLSRANEILMVTREYFRNPRRSPFPFDEYGVDYVLLAKEPYALGTPAIFSPNSAPKVGKDERLRLVRETSDLVLYEVSPIRVP